MSAPLSPETLVWVSRQWNDNRGAAFRLGDLERPHWSAVSGGVRVRANRAYVHAYVWCDAGVEGELAHSCLHGEGPHRIKVCVTAVTNGGVRSPLVRHLRALADEDRDRRNARHRAQFGGAR